MVADLRVDDGLDHCGSVLGFMAWFFVSNFTRGQNAYAYLPSWRESKRMRNDRVKAERRGFVCQREWLTPDVTADILTIFRSAPTRQGRPISLITIRPSISNRMNLNISNWSCSDYYTYRCPRHWLGFWGVRQEGRLVAFAEIVVAGNVATPLNAIGHADLLRNGIMNQLFSTVMHDLADARVGWLFFSSDKNLAEGSMGLFMRGAGITGTSPVTPLGLKAAEEFVNV